MSASGHERRPLRWMAANRLPLFPVCDRSHATVQNDAMGHEPTSAFFDAGEVRWLFGWQIAKVWRRSWPSVGPGQSSSARRN